MLQDLVQLNMNRIQQQAGPEAAHTSAGADSSPHAPPISESSLGQAQASPPAVDSRVVPIQVGDTRTFLHGGKMCDVIVVDLSVRANGQVI